MYKGNIVGNAKSFGNTLKKKKKNRWYPLICNGTPLWNKDIESEGELFKICYKMGRHIFLVS